ncbi:MAG: CocE/NonD family hydrolase [Bacteroidetes bacterium]|nr:CocE/NonD family hydrolase [Bacteroidota bacterium]
MRKIIFTSIVLFFIAMNSFAQKSNNGKLDTITDFAVRYDIPFVMPDSIKLMTNVFLPVVQDCLMVNINFGFGSTNLELISKGTQLLIYDTLNGQSNPNPYKMPLIFTRTPYNKHANSPIGGILGLLGYAYAEQDMRGRYTSEGVYLPLYSDGWNKNPYHPLTKHVLDLTPLSDPKNGNKHEDGYNSIQFMLDTNNLIRTYDINNDGVINPATESFSMFNGRIGMFGGSALGYNQYQAAAAHRIDPSKPGLKCLLPIVGPSEFFKSTGFHNGVLRDRLVTGWLKGQIFTGTDAITEYQDSAQIANDNDIQNAIHSAFDYGLPNKFVAANSAIDHFCVTRYPDANGNLEPAGYYPNSPARIDMDVSRAMVDANGEGSATGTFSRYTNMEVPIYNLTGWYDIFIDGQIESRNYAEKYLSNTYGNKKLQKILIGPWAHGTIGSRETGDMVGANKYPENVLDGIGVNISGDNEDVSITDVLKSEFVSWYRYNLNYNPSQYLGDPKFMIPASHKWQGGLIKVRIPSQDFKMQFHEFLNFMNGSGGLNNLKMEYKDPFPPYTVHQITISIPALGQPMMSQLDNEPISPAPIKNFANLPNVKFYVIGPVNDSANNVNVGNYWFSSNTFPPPTGISMQKMYLHNNGTVNSTAPTSDEGYKIYVHDPNDPVITAGGGNMLEQIPNSNDITRGQVDMTSPLYSSYTMNRPGVIQFSSNAIQDSLCIIGAPVATLYAKTNPAGASSGLTDTDFMVRILDVYPDGRELFVVEGAVNARARDYAKNLVDNPSMDEDFPFPNDNTPFTNINIGQVYEFRFKFFPIAYTWGKNHKIKILISSSNFPRFQVNPNIPIADGEFFRRKPGDGQGTNKTPDGSFMMPRVAVQRLAFSPQYPSSIELPVFTSSPLSLNEDKQDYSSGLNILVYPNPASDKVSIYLSTNSEYKAALLDITGKQLLESKAFQDQVDLDVKNIPTGIYLVEVTDSRTNEKSMRKLIINR